MAVGRIRVKDQARLDFNLSDVRSVRLNSDILLTLEIANTTTITITIKCLSLLFREVSA